ncbi:hypothetical protein KW782_00405 [Candidatus Parcubacteria bacterium]|nr:hypothetical protein [Candidatus Parcubacteria bacterium]
MNHHYLYGLATGIGLAILFRLVRDRGHALYGVTEGRVQKELTRIVRKYALLLPLNKIHSGGTHQQVFDGGTVIAHFDSDSAIAGLPRNARSYVVWGKKRRRKAAEELMHSLWHLGYNATIHEPLPFPSGTFIMVKSNAFIDNAMAFRPHWVKMAILDARSKKK